MDLWAHLAQQLYSSRSIQSWLHMIMSRFFFFFWVFLRMKTPPVPVPSHPYSKKNCFLMFRGSLQCLCPTASGSVTGHNWKDLDSVFTHSLQVLIKFPWHFSSITWTDQALSVFPYRREASVPLPSSCLHWPDYNMSMPYTGEPRTRHKTPAVSSPGLSRGEGRINSIILLSAIIYCGSGYH